MIHLLKCPGCEGEVSLLSNPDPEARVQCPLCDEKYVLGDFLKQLPPALIMLDAPAPSETELMPNFGGAVDSGQPDATLAPQFSFDASGGEGGVATKTAPATGSKTARDRAGVSRPRKRKQKSMTAEMIKIVLGGVAGLFIVYAGFIWISHRDILKEMAGVSPILHLPTWMQWAVPEEMRPAGDDQPENDPDDPAPEDPLGDATDSSGDAKTEHESSKDGESKEGGNTKKPGDESPDGKSPDDSKIDDPVDDGLDAPLPEPGLDEPKLDDPTFDPPELKDPALDEPPPADPDRADNKKDVAKDDGKNLVDRADDNPADAQTPAVRSKVPLRIAATVDAAQLRSEIEKAQAAGKMLRSGEVDGRRAKPAELYEGFVALCRAADARVRARAEDHDADSLQSIDRDAAALDKLAVEVDADKDADRLGRWGNYWLSKGTSPGIVVAGKVAKTTKVGPLVSVSIELQSASAAIPARTINVVTADMSSAAIKEGARVVILGSIVPSPERQIEGYAGAAERVIWGASIQPVDEAARIGAAPRP